MSAKKYRKKPVEVEAWVFPDNYREQAKVGAQLNDEDIETHFYDYAVQKSDTRFKDGAYWRWTAVHLEYRGDRFIAFIGDVIILDPLEGVRVVSSDLFSATHEDVQPLAEETYEYSYHIQNAIGMWEHPTPRAGDPERWWDTRGEAEESALAAHEYGYPIRIVRRHVSTVEVINE